MRAFSFLPNHFQDKDNIQQFANRYTDLYYNKHEFVNSLFEFYNGENEKFIIHYYPLNRLNINNNTNVKLPIYQIQKFTFIYKENHFLNYDLLKPNIELLESWANDLNWRKEYNVQTEIVDWQDSLNQIFTNGKHFDIKDLSKCFNQIEELILRHDEILLYKLQNIKNSDELVQLINTFLINQIEST